MNEIAIKQVIPDKKKKRSRHDYLRTLLSRKELCDFKDIHSYFKKHLDKVIVMVNIIDGSSRISLRILDWFVTRYADMDKTNYKVNDDDKDFFYVHISYKSQLKSYTKKRFDPFRRREKFDYFYKNACGQDSSLKTTLGQLNFFRWATKNKVIEYVDEYYNDIVKAMNASNKESKKVRDKKKDDTQPIIKKKLKIANEEIKMKIEKEKDEENNIVDLVISFE